MICVGPSEIWTQRLKQADTRSQFILFAFGERLPPFPEFICVFNFPYREIITLRLSFVENKLDGFAHYFESKSFSIKSRFFLISFDFLCFFRPSSSTICGADNAHHALQYPAGVLGNRFAQFQAFLGNVV